MTDKLGQNANFLNGGGVHYSNGCPACTVEQVVNIFTVIVNGTSAYSEMQKE